MNISKLSKTKYTISFLQRIFRKKTWNLVDTEIDNIKYCKTFTGAMTCNILIGKYEWVDDKIDKLLGRKITITTDADTMGFHLSESKKVIEALKWLEELEGN